MTSAQSTARRVIAVAGTASPDRFERMASEIVLFTMSHELRTQPWWRWTAWLMAGITIARIRAAMP